MRIYVASSWRNPIQPDIVAVLRAEGHDVYDFRNPAPGVGGFQWSDIDKSWEAWSAAAFRDALDDPIAVAGFEHDMVALTNCDACVLVLPCGRSAHLELGWACGVGKLTVAFLLTDEPELMYRMVDHLVVSIDELVAVLEAAAPGATGAASPIGPAAEPLSKNKEKDKSACSQP